MLLHGCVFKERQTVMVCLCCYYFMRKNYNLVCFG